MIYTTPFRLTSDSKVLIVQYKLIHRILACNKNLKKWKIRRDDLCDYCHKLDTIEHFMVSCPSVLILWHSIINWCKTTFQINIPLDIYELLFGIPNENEEVFVNQYNFVILHAKYYIYYNKKRQKPLDLYEFLLSIKHELILKKTVCQMHNKMHIFDKTWGELYANL